MASKTPKSHEQHGEVGMGKSIARFHTGVSQGH